MGQGELFEDAATAISHTATKAVAHTVIAVDVPLFSFPESVNLNVTQLEMASETGNAIQGELFAADGDAHPTKGYRGTVASKVAGITYRQLDYWARKRIVEPSITPSHGSGSRRLYSFKDVLILAVSKKLLDAGVNLQNVTAAIAYLQQRPEHALRNVTIMCDGQRVIECGTGEQLLHALEDGTAVFAVSVGALWQRIDMQLAEQESIDLTLEGMTRAAGSAFEDLTAQQLRKSLARRRRQHASIEKE